jgi:1,4-dihydroxy-2-naphthoate octaprenyltransferase
VNDYFDCIRGVDTEERLGPERACSQGWITLSAMRKGISIVTLLACCTGLPLVAWGGVECILVGIACVVFCFLYTTCLSYLGYGDLLVLVFFGVVPVCVTYYVVTGDMNWPVLLAGIACGLATDCLLMVNNYRDRNEDAVSGKRTLVVRFGSSFGLSMYLWLGVLAFLLGAVSLVAATGNWYAVLPLLLYALSHIVVYRKMRIIDGRALNGILGATARNIILFSLLYGLGLLLM